MHKTFFLQFSFFIILFISLVDIIGIKAASGDHKSNFKKGGPISSEPNMLFFVYHRVIVFSLFLSSTNRGEEKWRGVNFVQKDKDLVITWIRYEFYGFNDAFGDRAKIKSLSKAIFISAFRF